MKIYLAKSKGTMYNYYCIIFCFLEDSDMIYQKLDCRPGNVTFAITPDGSFQTSDWLCLIAGVIVMICVSMKQESGVRIREALGRQSLWFQWLVTIGIILVILVCGIYGPGYNAASFIYGGF